jgi:hypothetical protein
VPDVLLLDERTIWISTPSGMEAIIRDTKGGDHHPDRYLLDEVVTESRS